MIKRKRCLLFFILAVCIIFPAFSFNYGEALQKAIYFFECQVTGPKPEWNRCPWRGDSCMNDAVLGGWHDAGDHVKFGLPMAFSASMLGWAIYEYKDAIRAAGQLDELERNLRFVLDYFIACGQGSSFVYQIGDPGPDHAWWGPIEVIHKKMNRPSYTTNASCVTAQTAAALAIGSIVLNNSGYLTRAKALFSTADSLKSDNGYTAASGFYSSWSGFWDELLWAGVWLYLATNDYSYIDKVTPYIDSLSREGQDDPRIKFSWVQCWDDCRYGAILLLARITGKQEYHEFVQNNLNFWTVGTEQGERIKYTPGGLAWLDQWGCLRYASAAAFCAFIYADMISDSLLVNRYRNFAERQVNYALGDNPRNASYVCGYGANPPKRPHHRTSHGSWCDQQTTPSYHRHVLYGALVGGPDSGDGYKDEISDFVMNEVACDYNACFVAGLAKMYDLYGGSPLSDSVFPPEEIPEHEFFVAAHINSSGNDYTEIKANLTNQSSWPARLIKNLSFNYYINLSEFFAAGFSVDDLEINMHGSEIPMTLSDITHYSGDIYYIKISTVDGTDIAPIDQTSFEREVTFRIAAPNASGAWDPSNDYSYEGLQTQKTRTDKIPVYDGNTLIFGFEPDQDPLATQTPAPTETPTPAPTETPTTVITETPTPPPVETPTSSPGFLLGDVNENGAVDIIDALIVSQYYVGLDPSAFTAPAEAGDVNIDGNVNIVDALLISQYYVGIYTQLPVQQPLQ